jgi:hypothetical protein
VFHERAHAGWKACTPRKLAMAEGTEGGSCGVNPHQNTAMTEAKNAAW